MMCQFHSKIFIVKPDLAVRPSSVTDNLRGKGGGIIPSWAMTCLAKTTNNKTFNVESAHHPTSHLYI